MILHHQKFDLWQKCLIEKVIVKAPFRHAVTFQNEACFIYFNEGSTQMHSPTENTKIASKDAVLLKCGNHFTDLIESKTGGEYEIVVIHLYPEMLEKLYKNEVPSFVRQSPNMHFVDRVSSHQLVSKFIESLYFYFENPALVNHDTLVLKVKELLLLLVQTHNASSVIDLFNNLFSPRKASIKSVVSNHIFSEITVEDLAFLCGLSISTFKREFQQIFNTSPANYIKQQRLEKAKALLNSSELSISEITYETCFSDVAHFSRSFKSAFGVSPSEYRNSK